MKKILSILLISLTVLSYTACNDLDIVDKNLITDEDLLKSESGMEIYLATMYSHMPFEDFKYMPQWGIRFSSWLGATGISGTGEAVNRDGICTAFTNEDTPYWNFGLLRDANHLIENLPSYKGNFSEKRYNHYLGEAYFVRATVFYAMARRFGGVPLVTKVIPYPAKTDVLEVPRATEEETWNQVLADFDMAVELLEPKALKRGLASKYIALAFKSEAMLYAGSVAKYNETIPGRLTGLGKKTGVRVMGFDEDSWKEASRKYFTEAYKAAREVMLNGGNSLYKKKWSATDKEAQYQNMIDMFSDLSSPENIYVREYKYPTLTHGYDAYNAPFIFRNPLASGTCPTLDFLELFDGFDRYPNGTVKVTTGSTNTEGDYILYEKPMDFFKDAEPRLRAYVIFPGDMFKGKEIEIRAGIYTGPVPIKPLFNDYSYNSADTRYQHLDAYKSSPKKLYLSPRDGNSQELVSYKGETMTAAGANGPFYDFGEGNLTGLYGRKWLNPDPNFQAGEGKSDQLFVIMRYAEILLNAAEAAIELAMEEVASPDGSNLNQVATDAVNQIRERAGATLLTEIIGSNKTGLDIVRRERRKELAFEHKTLWDVRRWRVSHNEGRDHFWCEPRDKAVFSNGSRYRFRGLYPFFSTEAGKYFFDARYQWVSMKTFEYNTIDYYFAIPGGEVTKSSFIDQQPNR